MDVCSWIRSLPSSNDWPESDPQLALELASSDDSTRTVVLKAKRTSGSNTEALVTFSVCLEGFFLPSTNPKKTLWVSNPCPLVEQDPALLPLLCQLIQESIARSPTVHDSTITTFKLDPEPLSRALGSSPPEPSFSRFFNLVFLCRLFWLCACDAPAEVGFLYFQTLAPNLQTFLQCKLAMTSFLAFIGADGELIFMRTLGYMFAKWLILRDLGGVSPSPFTSPLGFSYARESHGLWVLKGYAPVSAMIRTCFNGEQDFHRILEVKETVLRYALAHQQLEAVIQLEYSVCVHETFIRVAVRLDNLRIHVTRLRFGQGEDEGEEEQEQQYADERHFPTRVQIRVSPGPDSSSVSGLTLGRSTENPGREVETQKAVKGSFGKSKFPKVKATARTSLRTRTRNWRWEQDAEGNTAVFEGVLCENTGGDVGSTWRKEIGRKEGGPKGGIRYSRALVFAGDKYGEDVSWRLGREEVMRETDGGDLKWRLGGKIWLCYRPCDLKTSYCETRCVEWGEEVDLQLPHGK